MRTTGEEVCRLWNMFCKLKYIVFKIFKGRLLQFVKPLENSVYTCHNPIWIEYLTRLRLGFSHLRYRKFIHGFLDADDPFCSCSSSIKNTVYYYLHLPKFLTVQNTLLNEVAIGDRPIIDQDDIKIIQTFLYGNPTYSFNVNKLILKCKYKVYFGNQKIWQTNFLGERVIAVKIKQLKLLFFFVIIIIIIANTQ